MTHIIDIVMSVTCVSNLTSMNESILNCTAYEYAPGCRVTEKNQLILAPFPLIETYFLPSQLPAICVQPDSIFANSGFFVPKCQIISSRFLSRKVTKL
jgi:hypothetical protein